MKIDKKQSEEKSEGKPVEKWLYLESRVFTEYYEDKKGIFCESQDKRIYLNCKIIRTPKKKTLLDGNCKIDNVDFTIMQYIKLEKLPDDPFELVLKLFGGIKKKLSGVRGQTQVKSIPDSSKEELITFFIKAFRKISEVSKNKKTALSSVGNFMATAESVYVGNFMATAETVYARNDGYRCVPVGQSLTLRCITPGGKITTISA